MYEASWERLASHIGQDILPAARAYVEFLIDQRQPRGREGPRNVPREQDRADILRSLCQDFDADYYDEGPDARPDARTYSLFCRIYDHLASAAETFKALCLIQKGVWKGVPDNFLKESAWEDPWCWDRLKTFALVVPDSKMEGGCGYRIPYQQFLDYGTLRARFFWEVPVPEHLLPAKPPKKKSEKLTLTLLSKTPVTHCYKFDEWCVFCAQSKEGMIHGLLASEVEVYPCRLSGEVEGNNLGKDGFICQDHLDKARQDPTLTVVG